MNEMNQFSYF